MNRAKTKKLLILGSTASIATIVEKAQEMGIYVIVTDYNTYEHAPAKQIADQYYDISLADVEAIVKLIKDEKIDGVLTGFTDSYLKYYYEICRKAKLPCYGNMEQFLLATDKAKFKEMCEKYNVGIIPGGMAKSIDDIKKIINKIGYPIILKPADNSGSRGVIRCDSKESLANAFDYAFSFSSIGCVICEKFMDCDNIGASYQLIDGKISLAAVSDRHIYKSEETGSSITKDLRYPSIYTERYIKEMNSNFITLLQENGFHDGMLSNQVFVDDKNFYMCEICFRPSGGQHFLTIYDQTGVDSLAMLIEYALNGKTKFKESGSPYFDKSCAFIRIVGKANERIDIIEGMDTIKLYDFVYNVTQHLFSGDIIGKDGTTAQTLFCICYRAENEEDLYAKGELLTKSIVCKNVKGENLIKDIPYFI